jgi:uncharacterized protein (DUF2384 family)
MLQRSAAASGPAEASHISTTPAETVNCPFIRTRILSRRVAPGNQDGARGDASGPSLRNRLIVLRYSRSMPIGVAQKVEALRVDFRSAAKLADLLGVSRSQVTRWLRGAGIDPLNAERVDLLEMVWANLLRLYDREAALSWLFGINPLLGDRRPIDLIRMGRAEELMRAIRAERSDTFS